MSEVLARCARYRSGAQSSRLAEREKETRRSGPLTASTKPMPSILSSVSVTASSLDLKRTISGPRRPPGHPQEEAILLRTLNEDVMDGSSFNDAVSVPDFRVYFSRSANLLL